MRVVNEIILQPSDASVNQTSLPAVTDHSWGYAVQVIVTGTAAGTVKLQGSCDPGPNANFQAANDTTVINWTDIANSSQPVTGAGTVTYDVVKTAYPWVRVVYTASSGTGTIAAHFNAKGF
jgi:hypothetical protein